MKIYISIPIANQDETAQRIHAADVAKELNKLGHETVNPFDTPEPPEGLSEEERYAWYMGEDIKRLMLCDAIFMCKGWGESKGCSIERAVAQRAGLRIIDKHEVSELESEAVRMLDDLKL